MAIKDLPYTAVPGFTGTVGDFIKLDLASDGEINAVILNPGHEPVKVIEDNGNARRYLAAAMDLPFRYKMLTQKQHLYIDVQANIGFTENAGVIWNSGTWYDADAYDHNLVSTGQAVKDTRFGADRFPRHMALNTILANTVKILVQDSQIDGLATHLSGILHAADIPAGLRIREEAFERRTQSRNAYLGARNRAENPGFEKPASLITTVDGEMKDLYTVTLASFQVVNPDGEIVGSLRWRGDATSIVQAQDFIEKGCSFRTRL